MSEDDQEDLKQWMLDGGRYLQYAEIPFSIDRQLKQRAAQKALEARF